MRLRRNFAASAIGALLQGLTPGPRCCAIGVRTLAAVSAIDDYAGDVIDLLDTLHIPTPSSSACLMGGALSRWR